MRTSLILRTRVPDLGKEEVEQPETDGPQVPKKTTIGVERTGWKEFERIIWQ